MNMNIYVLERISWNYFSSWMNSLAVCSVWAARTELGSGTPNSKVANNDKFKSDYKQKKMLLKWNRNSLPFPLVAPLWMWTDAPRIRTDKRTTSAPMKHSTLEIHFNLIGAIVKTEPKPSSLAKCSYSHTDVVCGELMRLFAETAKFVCGWSPSNRLLGKCPSEATSHLTEHLTVYLTASPQRTKWITGITSCQLAQMPF